MNRNKLQNIAMKRVNKVVVIVGHACMYVYVCMYVCT